MSDLILKTPNNKKIKITGLSSAPFLLLSTGKHTVSNFTPEMHLMNRVFSLLVLMFSLLIHSIICRMFQIPFFDYFAYSILFFFAVISALLYWKHPTRSIHGAEHMIIQALESRKPFTKELIRQQSIFSKTCGTTVLTAFFMIGMIPIFYKINEMISSHMPLNVNLAYSGIFFIGYCFLFINFDRFNFWIQKTFFVSPPTDFQLDMAYEQGVELIQKYNADPHPQSFFAK